MRHAPTVRANAWEDVADLAASLGIPLDDWQETVFQSAMGERSDGRWAARLIGLSTPRQNGKSQLIVSRALAGVLLFGERTIICSAHQTDTAREVFQRLLDVIESNPSVEKRVDSVMKAVGREHIRFKGGQTVKIKARSISGSRGFSADCLLLDEAQILGASAWSSILPTMSARENPQAWLLGTPPTPQDDGEVFARLRQRGIEGKDARISYLEWSADQGDDINDPAIWAKANPAFGFRITAEAVEAERSAMDDAQFSMERLGMWAAAGQSGVISHDVWTAQADVESLPLDRFALGVEVGPDLSSASVSLAGERTDGAWHVELDEMRSGAHWLVAYVERLIGANPQIRAVVGDVGGPLAALLEKRGARWFFVGTRIEVTPLSVRDLGAACSLMLNGLVAGSIWHTDQPQMNVAVAAAGKRRLGDTGMWVFSRSTATADITPIQSATLALWGAQNSTVKKPTKSAPRKVVVLS